MKAWEGLGRGGKGVGRAVKFFDFSGGRGEGNFLIFGTRCPEGQVSRGAEVHISTLAHLVPGEFYRPNHPFLPVHLPHPAPRSAQKRSKTASIREKASPGPQLEVPSPVPRSEVTASGAGAGWRPPGAVGFCYISVSLQDRSARQVCKTV
jgi:hypothetical protein